MRQDESKKDGWIPVGERLPEEHELVQVTIKRHRWISDYGNDKIPEEEKVEHPERIYCTFGRLEILNSEVKIWEFLDLELDDGCCTKFTIDCSTEDLSYPLPEVIAWMPMSELYEEDK